MKFPYSKTYIFNEFYEMLKLVYLLKTPSYDTSMCNTNNRNKM